LSEHNWINQNKFRVMIKHVKNEKRLYIKYINLKNQKVYCEGYSYYAEDNLDFTFNNPRDYTMILSGWGDGGGVTHCNGIVSDLHILQKSLSDEELAKYLAPLSISQDSLRAGLEFSELNNI
ncbi:hypothetical protein V6O07_04865, partial [Arthrospira platensis SPKY2]